ncbi:MAG: hypothetical protein DMG54_07190 [Acidobacteria bacterium]|nr:MAG: hypothetical protein DMG53_18490 [Acidobacteriota bacterium]PYU45119.1 MAG: hypothetical protein DMG54_07190 [Acidobacteriota bacterium]
MFSKHCIIDQPQYGFGKFLAIGLNHQSSSVAIHYFAERPSLRRNARQACSHRCLQGGSQTFELRRKCEGIEGRVHFGDILYESREKHRLGLSVTLCKRLQLRTAGAVARQQETHFRMQRSHEGKGFDQVPVSFFRDKYADAPKQEFIFSHAPVLPCVASLLRCRQWKDFHAFIDDGDSLARDA